MINAINEGTYKKLLVCNQKRMERNGNFIILIALVLAAPYVYQTFGKDKVINFNEFDKVFILDKTL